MKEKMKTALLAIMVLSPLLLSIAALIEALEFGSTRLFKALGILVLILFVVGVGFAGYDTPKRASKRMPKNRRRV